MKTNSEHLFLLIEEEQPRSIFDLGKVLDLFEGETGIKLTMEEAVANYHIECKLQKIKPIPIHGV